jgi:hypothetical protein
VHERFREAISQGFVPQEKTRRQFFIAKPGWRTRLNGRSSSDFGRYDIADFDHDCLQETLTTTFSFLKKIQTLVKPITPDKDNKFQTLKKWMKEKP